MMAFFINIALLLLNLTLILSTCGATEFYVRPTEPTNTSCPAQPCLTLSQYINDSDHYFISNTAFLFLSGIHRIDTPVIIEDVYNISLVRYGDGGGGEYPHVVYRLQYCQCSQQSVGAQCAGCTAFQFQNVTVIHVEGLMVEVESPNDSISIVGLGFGNVTHLIVKDCKISSNITQSGSEGNVWGIILLQTRFVDITSITSLGNISVYNSHNATIRNTTFEGSELHITDTENTEISNMVLTNPPNDGISLKTTVNILIHKVTIINPNVHGVRMENTLNTHVMDTTITDCGDNSITVDNANKTLIVNTYMMYSHCKGIDISESNNVQIYNTVIHNTSNCAGINVYTSDSISIVNTSITNSKQEGVLGFNITNTSLVNTDIEASGISGVYIMAAYHTNIVESRIVGSGHGNGLTLSYSTDTVVADVVVTGSILVLNCTWTNFSNISVKNVTKQYGIWVNASTGATFSNSSFTGLSFPISDISNLPAVIVLYQSSSIYFSQCSFFKNPVSALKAVASRLTLLENVTFTGNRASKGAAITFQQNSVMTLTANSSVVFEDNHATTAGGALYIDSNPYYTQDDNGDIVLRSDCILEVDGEGRDDTFVFVNNSAEYGGDVLFGGQLGIATTSSGTSCLREFKKLSRMEQSNPLSIISSQPSRVCICNERGIPDCETVFDTIMQPIFSGQTINIPAVVVGQDLGAVAGSVFAQFSQTNKNNGHNKSNYYINNNRNNSYNNGSNFQLVPWQHTQGVSQYQCNQLSYTIFSHLDSREEVHAVLVLSAAEMNNVSQVLNNDTVSQSIAQYEKFLHNKSAYFPQDFLMFPVYVNITLLPCPVGFTLTRPRYRCDCNKELRQLHGVTCSIQNQTIGHSGLVWIGPLHNASHGTVGVVSAAYCPFLFCKDQEINVSVADFNPDVQCNYDHSGTLCGGCRSGLSLALGSNQCLPCTNSYLALLIPFAVAGVVLVLLIKALDLTVSYGLLNGLIFYSNIVHSIGFIFIPRDQTNPLTIFIAWTNLDLGIETCFFDGLTAYWKTWLQFLFPLYIWGISGIIILSAKHIGFVAKLMGNNSVPVLATLFLLSYAKLLRMIISVLSYSVLEYPQSQKVVWSLDGNIDFLGSQHLPLFVAAVAVLLILWLPYTLLLLLGQWLHKCNNRMVKYILLKLMPFLDAYYGPLKGTHRYWFGLLLLLRAMIFVIHALVPSDNPSAVVFSISVTAAVLLALSCLSLGFYRSRYVSAFEMIMFSNLMLLSITKLYTLTSHGNGTDISYLFIGAAFIQFCLLLLFQLTSVLRPCVSEWALKRGWLCKHQDPVNEEDWEPYEQAALLRNTMNEENERNDEESIPICDHDIPTYGI